MSSCYESVIESYFLSHPKTKFIQKTVTFDYLFDDKYKELLYFTFPESKIKLFC